MSSGQCRRLASSPAAAVLQSLWQPGLCRQHSTRGTALPAEQDSEPAWTPQSPVPIPGIGTLPDPIPGAGAEGAASTSYQAQTAGPHSSHQALDVFHCFISIWQDLKFQGHKTQSYYFISGKCTATSLESCPLVIKGQVQRRERREEFAAITSPSRAGTSPSCHRSLILCLTVESPRISIHKQPLAAPEEPGDSLQH